jgi:hypothetical protein
MTTTNITVGELLYEVTVDFTGVTEYGASMADIASGQAAPPPEGARFDVAFEGSMTGPKLQGTVKGVDYINIRADGRAELHIHGEFTTQDNQKIALFADGVATPEEGKPGISTAGECHADHIVSSLRLGKLAAIMGNRHHRHRPRAGQHQSIRRLELAHF